MELLSHIPYFSELVDFLFPPLCLGCGGYNDSDQLACNDCVRRLQIVDDPTCINCGSVIPFGNTCPVCGGEALLLYSDSLYVGPMEQIIVQYKFHGLTSPAEWFAERLVDRFGDRLAALDVEAIVPVPLHPSRQSKRGYNQAALFAKRLAERLDVPVHENVVVRTKNCRPQSRLAPDQREKNVKGAFKAIEDVAPLRLILVDDVVTTGSTIVELASEVQRAGHTVAGLVSMARTQESLFCTRA